MACDIPTQHGDIGKLYEIYFSLSFKFHCWIIIIFRKVNHHFKHNMIFNPLFETINNIFLQKKLSYTATVSENVSRYSVPWGFAGTSEDIDIFDAPVHSILDKYKTLWFHLSKLRNNERIKI